MTLIDTEKAAVFLGLSPRALRRLASEGRIPYYKAGRLLRFNLDEVLEALRQEPTALSDHRCRETTTRNDLRETPVVAEGESVLGLVDKGQ